MQRLQLPPTLFKLLVSTGLFSSLSIAQAVTFTVTNLNDSGAGSLRQAILDANAATGSDTIQISVEGTITFLYGQMNITDNLTINGPGASQLIISGDSLSRIFSIHQGATVTLNALSLQNGKVLNVEPNDGGAIHNQGTLNINHCVLSKNNAYDKGGAIFNSGALNVRRSVLSANVAGGRGGTIYNYGATTLTESTLSDNTTGSHGGGITNYADNSKPSTLTIVSSTLSGNSANTSSGEGGGIYNQQDTSSNLARVTITNSTLSANTSNSHGGGIRNYNGTIKIYNSTISKNNAIYNGVGGGIYSTRMQAVVDLYNNVIAGNLYRGTESNIAIGEVPINHESNLFGTDGNAGLSGLTPAASDIVLPGPLSTVIDELANNGGPTQTHLPVPAGPR